MPNARDVDHHDTSIYIPLYHRTGGFTGNERDIYQSLVYRLFHEGRVMLPDFLEDEPNLRPTSGAIGSFRLIRNLNGTICVRFTIDNVLTLENFAQILRIPFEGVCLNSHEWSISSLQRILRILILQSLSLLSEEPFLDLVMSSASSAGYDGLPMQPVAPPSPDYVPGPEHPPSPDYVPSPEHPPSPVKVPYVPELDYPEYLVPFDAEAPLEEQPQPADTSPTALSPGYDGDDEPFDDDDDDTNDKDEEPFEYENDGEEEERLALADSSTIPVVDHVPSVGDTDALKTDEAAPTLIPSPRRHMAMISVRPQTPIPFPSKAEVEILLALPIPPPSPLSPWSSLLPQIPLPPLPPTPSSLHLPPPVPTSLPLSLSPLPPLPASLFIPPLVDHREDIPKAELPPHKRLCPTAPTSRYEVGESSNAAPRPTRGHRADYGFIGTMDAEIRHQRAEEASYGIRDGQLSAALGQIQALQARDQTHTDDHEGAASTANNMPLRRSSATARAAAAARAVATAFAAAAPMTATAVEQLIKAKVSAALANHETLRNSTNGQGDRSHNSDTRIRGTMESVFHISNCAVENQVKFATCTFLGNALTWWNSYMKTITGEINKLEIELWNLKVKGTDVASYTLRFQELALMCGRMFQEESDEVEKYVGGLPDMIQGNVMSYQPKTMEKAIKFANDQMDKKVLTITERQTKQKRKGPVRKEMQQELIAKGARKALARHAPKRRLTSKLAPPQASTKQAKQTATRQKRKLKATNKAQEAEAQPTGKHKQTKP
ncbi:hypothetical protein Tco_1405040 [Tanacetum coccineum]